MICEKCGTKMQMEQGVVYTSNPPMFGYVCPKCGAKEYSHTPEYDNDIAAVPPTEEQIKAELEKQIKVIISKTREEKLSPLVSQMTRILCDAFEAGFDAGMKCGKYVNYKQTDQ